MFAIASRARLPLAGIFLLAFSPALLFVYLLKDLALAGDPGWYHTLALMFLEGGQYVNPHGEQTAWKTPGYVLTLAAVYRVFGADPLFMGILQSIIHGASAVLTYVFARYYLSRNWALAGSSLYAACPSLVIMYAPRLFTTTIYSFFVLLLLVCVASIFRKPTFCNVAAGLAVGAVSMYFRQDLVLFPCILFLVLLMAKLPVRRALLLSLLAVVAASVVLSPWIARNYVIFDRFMPFSTNGQYTFAVMNDLRLSDGIHWGDYPRYPPGVPSDIGHDASLYEIYWNDNGLRIGLEYIVSHPVAWIRAKAVTVFHLWYFNIWSTAHFAIASYDVKYLHGLAKTLWAIFFGLAGVGAARLCWEAARQYRAGQGWHEGILLLLMLLYWNAFYLFFVGINRYGIPMLPIVIILFALGLSAILKVAYETIRSWRRMCRRGVRPVADGCPAAGPDAGGAPRAMADAQ